MDTFKSATNIVLLLVTITMCLTYSFAVMKGIITPDEKQFYVAVGMVMVYFFTKKEDPTLPAGGK